MNTLAIPSAQRGTMALLTERVREISSPPPCEGCNASHPGGLARGVIIHEGLHVDVEGWVLWVFADGFSVSDENVGWMASCAACQTVPVLKPLRFSDEGTRPSQITL